MTLRKYIDLLEKLAEKHGDEVPVVRGCEVPRGTGYPFADSPFEQYPSPANKPHLIGIERSDAGSHYDDRIVHVSRKHDDKAILVG